jgi:hypothetical protein
MVERAGVIDIGGLLVVDDKGPFSYDEVEAERSSTPWSGPYFGYGKQWRKSPMNARSQLMSNFVTMQHHVFKLLHQKFGTFLSHMLMNQCNST